MTARLTTTVASAPVTIMGTTSDPSGYPLAGMTIALFDAWREEGARLDTTTTDDVGGYRFGWVPGTTGEEYRIEATDESGAHVFTHASVTIGPGITTTHHTTMPVAGYIQGKVTTQDGTAPAQPGGHVCVTAAGENTVQTVYVSAKGAFRLGGLPSGTFTVTLDDETSGQSTTVTVAVTAGSTTTIDDQVLNHEPACSAAR